MVEGSANEVSEEQFCEAVHLGFKEVRTYNAYSGMSLIQTNWDRRLFR